VESDYTLNDYAIYQYFIGKGTTYKNKQKVYFGSNLSLKVQLGFSKIQKILIIFISTAITE